MKKVLIFISLLLIVSIWSCKKENEDYFKPKSIYTIIEIDSLNHTYISKDHEYFFEGLFKSASDLKRFTLMLKEGKNYRFSSSQNFINTGSINLSLVNSNFDTITLSQNINHQNVLYYNALQDQEVILQAQLESQLNLSLDYRLFFEEREFSKFKFTNRSFEHNGNFSVKNNDTCVFTPSGSYWNRILKLNEPISSSISFDLKSKSTDFSFILNGSESFSLGNEFDDDLPNGMLFQIKNNQYEIIDIQNNASILIENGTLPFTITSNSAINIKVLNDATDSTKKDIFINNQKISTLTQVEFDWFYLIFPDRSFSDFKIFNFNKS